MYVLIRDFQYTDSSHAIMVLSSGTRFEREADGLLFFKIKNKEYSLEKRIADANPQFFKHIDFRVRLTELLKAEKTRTAPKLAELVHELVTAELIRDHVLVAPDVLAVMVDACYRRYLDTGNAEMLRPLDALGYTWDGNGYYHA